MKYYYHAIIVIAIIILSIQFFNHLSAWLSIVIILLAAGIYTKFILNQIQNKNK